MKSIKHNIFLNVISSILKEKCFKYISILFALYVTPIILSNNYYCNGDIHRAISDGAGWLWSLDGRPLADMFYRIFSADKQIIDVYPFPLILALFLLTLVLVLFYRRFGNNKPGIFSLSIFPVLSSPPFLENFQWRFDSAFMVLSLMFAIFPYVTSVKNNLSFWSGIVCLICTACLYQPALNVFIGAAALEGYYNLLILKNIKKSSQNIALRVAQFGIGLAIYLKLIIPLLSLNKYNNDYSKIIPINVDFFSKFITNFLSTLHVPNALWQSGGIRNTYALVCIAFLIITFILLKKYHVEEKPSRFEKIAIIFLLGAQCLIAGMVALSGIIMFSEHSEVWPRVYIGWGMSVCFLLLPHCWIGKKYAFASFLVPSLCAWIFFTLNFAIVNATKEEYNHRRNLALSIIKDLDLLKLNDQELTVYGKPPVAPTTRSLIKVFPFIQKLVNILYYKSVFLFVNGSGRNIYDPKLSKEQYVEIEMEKLTPFHVMPYYKFYKLNDIIVICFSEN